GLVLLVLALAVPLFVVGRARRNPLGAAALGAYVAFLAHAGVDWDWELPAVTLTALACAAAVLVAARRGEAVAPARSRLRWPALAVALALGAAAFVGAVGHTALDPGG